MSKSTDKLADALFDGDFPYEYGYEWQPISRDHLRTLAREAAKGALLEAAKSFVERGGYGDIAMLLERRAEQIGE